MYLDKPIIKSSEDACLLFKAAVAYQIPHLCQLSATVLSKSLNLENIWMVLRLVADTLEPSLTAECGKVWISHVVFNRFICFCYYFTLTIILISSLLGNIQ